ncbi:MAG: lipid biosynthesis acyltransferase [Anaeromyxobacteraceae bacterium]|nr:lipid biosynthesis acyltransferase [Anaeromyxobacteraceae bacterium]
MSQVPWAKQVRRTARIWAIRAGLRLGSVLPFRLVWAVGGLIGQVAWWVGRRDRELALAHLALAFPEKSEAERRAIAHGTFLHYGHGAAEAAQMDRLDRELEKYVSFAGDGEALLRAASQAGKGFIFVTGHLGSWELLARRIVRAGVPAIVIAARSWDRRLDDMVEAFRLRGGVPTLFREDPSGGRTLLKALRDGKALGILIDQDTKVQSVFVPFFGHLASTPRAAADLALRFGCPVFVGWSRRRGPRAGDGYVLEVEPVVYDPAPANRDAEAIRITAACTARMEQAIRQAPSEWVWMHRRWKTKPPESR